jgi:hypothetical protein
LIKVNDVCCHRKLTFHFFISVLKKKAYLVGFTDATLPVFFRYIFHWRLNALQMEHCWTGLAAK